MKEKKKLAKFWIVAVSCQSNSNCWEPIKVFLILAGGRDKIRTIRIRYFRSCFREFLDYPVSRLFPVGIFRYLTASSIIDKKYKRRPWLKDDKSRKIHRVECSKIIETIVKNFQKYFAVNEENKNLPIDEPGIFFLHHHRGNQTLKFVSEIANKEAKPYIHCLNGVEKS